MVLENKRVPLHTQCLYLLQIMLQNDNLQIKAIFARAFQNTKSTTSVRFRFLRNYLRTLRHFLTVNVRIDKEEDPQPVVDDYRKY